MIVHTSRCSSSNGSPPLSSASSSPLKIAVIGAGAAGLAAARVISRSSNNHHNINNNMGDSTAPAGAACVSLTVLEKDHQVGGIWQYGVQSSSSNSKSRPMYRGLRTNLPKEVMQYREYPWTMNQHQSFTKHEFEKKSSSFVTHAQVAKYLQDYETHFELTKYIQFGSTVKQVTMLLDHASIISSPTESWPKIQVEWETQSPCCKDVGVDSISSSQQQQQQHKDIFDAVVVANGHYSQPSIPAIPGMAEFYKGNTMHSISYDDPQDFQGQTVLCIGGRASGSDLAREISFYARKVFVSDSLCTKAVSVTNHNDDGTGITCPNSITWVPKTIAVQPDGSITFDHNCPLHPIPDTIIFCTGYDYHFSFLNEHSNLELHVVPGERRVAPLYKQLWHAKYPNLAFVGLPHSVVPFPLMELQCEAVWHQWQQHGNLLPNSAIDRLEEATTKIDADNGQVVVTDTHYLGDAQWDYCLNMARLAGMYDHPNTAERIEEYIRMNQALYDYTSQARKSILPGGPDTYRRLIFHRDDSQQKFDVVDPLTAVSSSSTTTTTT